MLVKIKKLAEDAKTPFYGTEGAACFDICACIPQPITVYGGTCEIISTGIAMEVPEGYVLELHSRSGHGFKHAIRLLNCTGIIDSDFRGELKVGLRNDGERPYQVVNGEPIAQAKIVPIPRIEFEIVDELSSTVRGENGFGHTTKKD